MFLIIKGYIYIKNNNFQRITMVCAYICMCMSGICIGMIYECICACVRYIVFEKRKRNIV